MTVLAPVIFVAPECMKITIPYNSHGLQEFFSESGTAPYQWWPVHVICAMLVWWGADALCSITLHLFPVEGLSSISIWFIQHIMLHIYIYMCKIFHTIHYSHVCIFFAQIIAQTADFLGIQPWCQLVSCKLGTACPAPNAWSTATEKKPATAQRNGIGGLSMLQCRPCNEASPPDMKTRFRWWKSREKDV